MGVPKAPYPTALAMTTLSLPEDKIKIAFYGFMMFIQNFGFFIMYFLIYISIPNTGACTDTRSWVGTFALDCFVESFVCVWMAMAGYTDDGLLFPITWILHLLVALPYCICTVGIPTAIYADQGKACLEGAGPRVYPIKTVYWTHCILFLVYVWVMLSVTYYSFAKASFFYPDLYKGKAVVAQAPSGGTSPVHAFDDADTQ